MFEFLKETTEEHNRIMEDIYKRELAAKRQAKFLVTTCTLVLASVSILEIVARSNKKKNR